ncbi:MAG: M15 family metallopeptidase [bacterium]|nr:M15 family metallopeptidase [bacterium]
MQHKGKHHLLANFIPVLVAFLALGGVQAYEHTRVSALSDSVLVLSGKLASTTNALLTNTISLSENITDLRAQSIGLSNTISSTQQNIDAVNSKVGGVEQAVGSISGAVGSLQKLSQIDPELLIKYSKVYFTNENYAPAHLTEIPTAHLYNEDERERFVTEAWPYLKGLLDSAETSGVTLFIKSAYRSFGEQQSLKSIYRVIYGAGTANSFSADQGYSEHQLGTTADFITTGLGGQLEGFDGTNAFQWLINNAYRFGFVLSYPKGNNYYVYEPWHWRFVGVKLATHLHENKLNFYDVDQREIDMYLVSVFD